MHGEYSVTVTQQFVALPFSVRLAVFPPLARLYGFPGREKRIHRQTRRQSIHCTDIRLVRIICRIGVYPLTRCKLKHIVETWRNWSDAGE